MNILITSASRKIGLVRSFQKALSLEGGGEVIAVDINPYAPALFVADKGYLVPRSTDPEFLPALLTLIRRYNVALVIPTRDEELPLLAACADDISRVGARVMVPAPETVAICQDKLRFVEFCHQAGFDTPKTFNAVRSVTDRDYPLFVRGRVGKGSRKAVRVNSPVELRNVLDEIPDPLIQEYVDAPEYTVDYFADFTGHPISVIPRRRLVVVAGESFVGETVRDQLLIEQSIALGRALGLVGHNTIQCFRDGEQVKFIEVNPRYGGGATIGFAAGGLTPLYLIQLLKGKPVQPRIGEFHDRLVVARFVEDIIVCPDQVQGVDVADPSRDL